MSETKIKKSGKLYVGTEELGKCIDKRVKEFQEDYPEVTIQKVEVTSASRSKNYSYKYKIRAE